MNKANIDGRLDSFKCATTFRCGYYDDVKDCYPQGVDKIYKHLGIRDRELKFVSLFQDYKWILSPPGENRIQARRHILFGILINEELLN